MIVRFILEQCLQAAIGEEPTGAAGYVLLAVIAAALLLIAVALLRRPGFVYRPEQGRVRRRADGLLSGGVVVLAFVVVLPGLWQIGGELDLFPPLRAAVIGFALLATVKFARQAREAAEAGRARVLDATLAFYLAAVLAGLALVTSGSATVAVIRIVVPAAAVLLWRRDLDAARTQARTARLARARTPLELTAGEQMAPIMEEQG